MSKFEKKVFCPNENENTAMEVIVMAMMVLLLMFTSKKPLLLTQGRAPREITAKKRRRRAPEGKALRFDTMFFALLTN